MRLTLLSLLVAPAVVLLAFEESPLQFAQAAVGPDCSWYDYQVDAQSDLDITHRDYPTLPTMDQLDPGGDGVACPDLPARPEQIRDAVSIRGSFDEFKTSISVGGVGYSTAYRVELSGVTNEPTSSDDSPCPALVTNRDIAALFELQNNFARRYYLLPPGRQTIPPGDEGGRFDGRALVWTVFDDPAQPVLINEWLLRNGLAFADIEHVPQPWSDRLAAAEDAAKADGLGVWGTCELPSGLVPPPATPEGQVVSASNSGDQIVAFSVEVAGIYLVTLDAGGGNSVFVALDVYSADGTWLPEFSITTASGGTYTSAGPLPAGDFYVQVKAVGAWKVTIEQME